MTAAEIMVWQFSMKHRQFTLLNMGLIKESNSFMEAQELDFSINVKEDKTERRRISM